MLYSSELIQTIKRKVNMLDVVSKYTTLAPMGHNVWGGTCPHPDHHDSTPSFRLWFNSDATWSWSCMGCHCGAKDAKHKNYGSDIIAFIMWMSDYKGSTEVITFPKAVEKLAHMLHLEIKEDEHSKEYSENKRKADTYHKGLIKGARDYLLSRGLTDEDIQSWNIGYTKVQEESGTMVGRITFPLYDKHHRVVGFSNRKMPAMEKDDWIPKYKNSKTSTIFNKSKYLYGIHRLDKNHSYLYITEGVFDVILASKYGLPNVVATLGTSFTKEHVLLIKELGLTPCFCMDADAAGNKAMERAVSMLQEEDVTSLICTLPTGKDMADVAQLYGFNLVSFIQLQTKPYWMHIISGYIAAYDAAYTMLKANTLTQIMEASKPITTMKDQMILKQFVKERLGIEI